MANEKPKSLKEKSPELNPFDNLSFWLTFVATDFRVFENEKQTGNCIDEVNANLIKNT